MLLARQLLQKFHDTYLPTRGGKEHIEAYGSEREVARANFTAIQQMAAQGHDITDAVLLKLLPYTNTSPHRQLGAWISHAPVISSDLRKWFEKKHWRQSPDEWPHVASNIWQFIEGTIQSPDALDRTIVTFSASPYAKGFQSGFLTPILNALDPVHFCIFNRKTRGMLKQLTGIHIGQELANYPEANRAVFRLASDLEATIRQLQIPLTPIDILDTFAHWLAISSERITSKTIDENQLQRSAVENGTVVDAHPLVKMGIGSSETVKVTQPSALPSLPNIAPSYTPTPTTAVSPSSIFISYARVDTPFVDRLVEDLHAVGMTTWVDRSQLEGGQSWLRVITEAIDACSTMLVVLSPNAVQSDYVESEYLHAHKQKKRIIPIKYHACKVPILLARLQIIDFQITSYEKGMLQLIKALFSHNR